MTQSLHGHNHLHLHSGTVWQGEGHETAEQVLVIDGVITAVGAEVTARLTGLSEQERERVQSVDLEGGFLMPAFGDGHAHPLFGGLEGAGPAVRACTSVEQIVEEVRHYAEEHPELPWILGASYDGSLAPEGLFDARWLDEAVSDRPVALRAWDYHTVWCNSAALEVAGITAQTPDPELGEIPRHPDGRPWGTLREWGAIDLVMQHCPPRDTDTLVDALRRASRYFLEHGVSWVQDAWVEPENLEAYLAAAEQDALEIRYNLAFYADPRHIDHQLEDFAAQRVRVQAAGHPHLTANTVKFFADGVIENETGALLQPYCSGLHDHGMTVWEGDSLAHAAAAVDALGFQIHIHAIGDAAVRQALDAIEHAVSVNGPRDRRPVIAHAQLVDEQDLPRFSSLGVIPCMQPLWAQPDALMTVLQVPRLGTGRSDQQYRMRTLRDDGAALAFGSDWPCSSGAPLEGVAVAVSRQTEDGEPDQGWTPQERLDLGVSLDAYSTAVAHQGFADLHEHQWGRIRPGAAADLVWLAQDPRGLTASGLRSLPVRATFVGGRAHLHPTD